RRAGRRGARLGRAALGNVSIQIGEGESPDTFVVAGRGELQIAILIETLRREGYELAVSRPEIIRREIDGRSCEPVEDVLAEAPEWATGVVVEGLASPRARIVSMEHRR